RWAWPRGPDVRDPDTWGTGEIVAEPYEQITFPTGTNPWLGRSARFGARLLGRAAPVRLGAALGSSALVFDLAYLPPVAPGARQPAHAGRPGHDAGHGAHPPPTLPHRRPDPRRQRQGPDRGGAALDRGRAACPARVAGQSAGRRGPGDGLLAHPGQRHGQAVG